MIVVPIHSSESREHLPAGYVGPGTIIANSSFALYDAPLWHLALIVSRLHLVWIGTVCGKIKTDFRYSNTLGWHTFPVPMLTEKNKADLTACAENIEHPSGEGGALPGHDRRSLRFRWHAGEPRVAHDRNNDEVLERIYIGRRFRNDTERLEKLFELYTKMTEARTIP